MNRWLAIFTSFFLVAIRAYPKAYRAEFEEKMNSVFVEMATEAAKKGFWQLLLVFLAEFRDLPFNVFLAHLKKENTMIQIGKSSISIRWMARLLSVMVSSMFLLIMFLLITNEDKPQGMAIPVLVLLALTIMGCLVAWRWEKAGGIVVVTGALCLYIATSLSGLAVGLGSLSFLVSLIYGVPFLIVGILFLVCCQRTRLA